MKPNRSNNYTTGLCNTFVNDGRRTFFFELDKDDLIHYDKVIDLYEDYELDVIWHKTGSGGIHFISPTMITKESWKELMQQLKGINPKCPMTTLRMEPNKYPNEAGFWYVFTKSQWSGNMQINSREMCFYLNKLFGCDLAGLVPTELKIVRYPLPLMP